MRGYRGSLMYWTAALQNFIFAGKYVQKRINVTNKLLVFSM